MRRHQGLQPFGKLQAPRRVVVTAGELTVVQRVALALQRRAQAAVAAENAVRLGLLEQAGTEEERQRQTLASGELPYQPLRLLLVREDLDDVELEFKAEDSGLMTCNL